ncbi:unnamed protein product [Spodoptera littoralis]|uniref:GST N-terminal domain-containing protein n=1 Tax=Spodoptera littoralis TaxID=7109 RepID=A0A9P0HWP5_SPOLI|nr:unnamed protein product [Spodoptera littoralis]CAH1635786.1 unnamed protein product [Spodoptera littoralis]
MPKKLSYFNLNGLAEPIRYILHYTNQEFEDVRYDVYSWPDPKIKASLPYGQFPVYEEDGRVLTKAWPSPNVVPTLSWGDFVFCGVIEASDMFLGIELSKDYPAVGTLVQHIRNLPGVKEYVKSIGPYTIDLARFKYKK